MLQSHESVSRQNPFSLGTQLRVSVCQVASRDDDCQVAPVRDSVREALHPAAVIFVTSPVIPLSPTTLVCDFRSLGR